MKRSRRGQSLLELMVGATFLVAITLGLLDLVVVANAETVNHTYAKNAARAAANYKNPDTAKSAVKQVLDAFKSSAILTSLKLSNYDNNSNITVETELQVHLPFPVPGSSQITLKAKDVEPVVF